MTGPSGAIGPTGATGPAGLARTYTRIATGTKRDRVIDVVCDPGDVATGGGAVTDFRSPEALPSIPLRAEGAPAGDGDTIRGWRGFVKGGSQNQKVTVFVACAERGE